MIRREEVSENMDIDAVLEALGNESRRRILSLLSKKPCYVSEISYSLKMAPKTVIEHLEKLEKAGLIRSFEEGRRRYYYIDKTIRLEILISPHRFKTYVGGDVDTEFKLDEINSIINSIQNFRAKTMSEMCKILEKADDMQRYFSKIQSMIASRLNEVFEGLIDEIERRIEDDVERLVMLALTKGIYRDIEIAEAFGLSYREVNRALDNLMRKGIVKRVVTKGEVVWKVG